MTSKKLVAVLIHGHHLQAPGWKELVWGTANLQEAGRVPRGIEIALREGADLIIWGTGASVDTSTGKKESEYTHSFSVEHAEELAQYLGVSAEEIVNFIQERSHTQLETQNTKEEVRDALLMCRERGIHALYLVSSPTHVPRCLLTAIQMQTEFPDILLFGVPADTSVEYWSPKDVAIVEPSHRPDRAGVPFNLIAKRLASARKYPDRAPQLYSDIERLLKAFDEASVTEA